RRSQGRPRLAMPGRETGAGELTVDMEAQRFSLLLNFASRFGSPRAAQIAGNRSKDRNRGLETMGEVAGPPPRSDKLPLLGRKQFVHLLDEGLNLERKIAIKTSRGPRSHAFQAAADYFERLETDGDLQPRSTGQCRPKDHKCGKEILLEGRNRVGNLTMVDPGGQDQWPVLAVDRQDDKPFSREQPDIAWPPQDMDMRILGSRGRRRNNEVFIPQGTRARDFLALG